MCSVWLQVFSRKENYEFHQSRGSHFHILSLEIYNPLTSIEVIIELSNERLVRSLSNHWVDGGSLYHSESRVPILYYEFVVV